MTKIILKRDKGYVSALGRNEYGRKGDVVDVENSFLELIDEDCYEIYEEKEEILEKPIDKMNKTELISKLKSINPELTDDELEPKTKAELIKLIEN